MDALAEVVAVIRMAAGATEPTPPPVGGRMPARESISFTSSTFARRLGTAIFGSIGGRRATWLSFSGELNTRLTSCALSR